MNNPCAILVDKTKIYKLNGSTMIIYKTTNLINGKIYIGKNQNNKKKYLGSGIYLRHAIKKYGAHNFTTVVIDIACTRQELNEKEKYWISFYNSTDRNIGYNIAHGGDGGYLLQHATISSIAEWKRKISDSNRGRIVSNETRKKISDKHRGKKLSNETKEKLSLINKGKKLSDKHKQKIGKSNTGRIVSDETRKKISLATLGKNSGKIPANKGIPLTDEQKQKLSKALRGKLSGEKNPSFGKKWLNNGYVNVYVILNEIDYYLSIGYTYGMLKNKRSS